MKPLRDLLKHSSIYAIGQILTRLASVLLLPMYTHCLSPGDYAVTAILDLTCALLGLIIGGGIASAVTRFHFEGRTERHADRVWWTALTYLGIIATGLLGLMWLGRQTLSSLTLGDGLTQGPHYYTLALATVWCAIVSMLLESHLRVQKRSVLFVCAAMCRLLLNISLNVWLLVGLDRGVEGLLLGNLLASAAHAFVLFVIFIRSRGAYGFDIAIAVRLARFCAPLVMSSILAMLMHEMDRYLLRARVSMDDVGVYSLAHKIGFAVNTLCLLPFSSIWHVAIYDIERLPHHEKAFARIFGWFVPAFGIVLLGAASTVHPVLPSLTTDAYGPAIDLIAVILLGFFFFGLSIQFEVPSLLRKRTALMVPGSVVGVITNLTCNLLLIPRFGIWGAAWSGVITYCLYSCATLLMCRRAMRIPYPFLRTSLMILMLCSAYLLLRFAAFPLLGRWWQLGVSVATCGLMALLFFGKELFHWWSSPAQVTEASAERNVPVSVPFRADAVGEVCSMS